MFTTRITTALLLTLGFAVQVPAATPEELEIKLQALATQVQSLQAEIAAIKAQNAANAASAPGSLAAAGAPAPALTAAPAGDTGLDWFGYGEINYSRPDASTDTTADVGRFVL